MVTLRMARAPLGLPIRINEIILCIYKGPLAHLLVRYCGERCCGEDRCLPGIAVINSVL